MLTAFLLYEVLDCVHQHSVDRFTANGVRTPLQTTRRPHQGRRSGPPCHNWPNLLLASQCKTEDRRGLSFLESFILCQSLSRLQTDTWGAQRNVDGAGDGMYLCVGAGGGGGGGRSIPSNFVTVWKIMRLIFRFNPMPTASEATKICTQWRLQSDSLFLAAPSHVPEHDVVIESPC